MMQAGAKRKILLWAHPKLPDGRDLVLWEQLGCHSFPARAPLLLISTIQESFVVIVTRNSSQSQKTEFSQ
jgi:hypothetical protein